ncbi:MAG: type II toxin-antitoxin system RelE/ParE family toxin [Dethiobacter sp.]|jgi:plasmid stabilization system protein ParE|nr:type II toxin-antitoxin system RelE/ParE family toxin [Dethiobacter sp.]MBS4022651.1 type II toxin-antitoxin system RelE/ParE family toxin [Dethiobacter sp.]
MKYKIRINPVAISDVQLIKEHIAEDSPDAAAKFGNTLYSKIENLSDFPEIGTSLSTRINIKTDYSFIVYDRHLIFYKVEGQYVSVYRVLHGARDYLSILFTDDLGESKK